MARSIGETLNDYSNTATDVDASLDTAAKDLLSNDTICVANSSPAWPVVGNIPCSTITRAFSSRFQSGNARHCDMSSRRCEERQGHGNQAIALRRRGLLLCCVAVVVIYGCASSRLIEMDSYDPSYNQTEIANYYRNQATSMREKADAQATAAMRYEALFGREADLVSGAKSLAHYYEQTAQELERVAQAHEAVDRNKRTPAAVR